MSELTIEQLEERVEKGKQWLIAADSDPPGRFYLWFKSGLVPGQKMPAQPQEVQDRYKDYHRALTLWYRLYAQLEARTEGHA